MVKLSITAGYQATTMYNRTAIVSTNNHRKSKVAITKTNYWLQNQQNDET